MKKKGRRSRGLWLGVFLLLGVFLGPVHTWALDEPMREEAYGLFDVKLLFTDGSGSFLHRTNNRWYAKDRAGKPLTGLVYVEISDFDFLETGYYYFNDKGRLETEPAIYRFRKKKVHGRVFDGYYYHTETGRFRKTSPGLRYLPKGFAADDGRSFEGFHYVGAYGKLNAPAQTRRLKAARVGGVSFEEGYYYFYSSGLLSRKKTVRKVVGELYGREVRGLYYFGGTNGRLLPESGWKQIEGAWYYFSSTGRAYQNRWCGEYYLGEDGKMLVNSRTPDGKYVDYTGKRCEKGEMRLSWFRDQLQRDCQVAGGQWGIYVEDLKTGDYLQTSQSPVYAASVIKPFVMASLYDCLERGQLTETASLHALLNGMITVSDNEAYNELVRKQGSPYGFANGAWTVNQYLAKEGYTGTSCRHTLHPSGSASFGIGGRNTVTARDCGVLLGRIYRGTCVSKKASKEMENLLLNQKRRGKIPAGLPAGIRCANKTGETSSTQHDMAIVWGDETDYVLAVTSSGLGEASAVRQIREISRKVYAYLNS